MYSLTWAAICVITDGASAPGRAGMQNRTDWKAAVRFRRPDEGVAWRGVTLVGFRVMMRARDEEANDPDYLDLITVHAASTKNRRDDPCSLVHAG